jgi:hypothetical protein
MRVDVEVPVDALDRVPLLVLALLVEREQFVAAVVVLPAEPGVAAERHVPGLGADRGGVELVSRHWLLLWSRTYAVR